MAPSPGWKVIAAASAVVVLASACADGEDSLDTDDHDSGIDGNPASEMRGWDADCDWFHLDDLQDFLGFEEWSTGPMEASHGGGSNPSAITCEASFLWPEFEGPSGYTVQPDATFGYDVYPRDSREDAEELFEHRVEHMQKFLPQEEAVDSGTINGEWLDSYYSVTDRRNLDTYFVIFQGDDFVMDFSIDIPNDPTDRYDESDLVPGEWAGFEFDQESAAEFLFEEQMPNIYDQFMTLLERNG